MRSDPYQARARVLAIEAGLDPDAKIDRPGQRPMPLWCTFRDDARVEHELFDDGDAWRESDMGGYRQKAVAQLGTVGSGNHYVDLLRDEDGFVWIGVHFGSRGLGHTSATRYLKAAGGKDGMNVPPAVIDEDSELGRRYVAAMQLAGRYSYACRVWVVARVRRIFGGGGAEMLHNRHN